MRALVVYDSYFGNTKRVAKLIGKVLEEEYVVIVKDVTDFEENDLINLPLLVIGSPTRGFKPTKNTVNFLKMLGDYELQNLKIALFDTRMDIEQLDNKVVKFLGKKMGYALDTMEKVLKKNNNPTIIATLPVYVKDTKGPLVDGEIEKIKQWANQLIK
jgi:flavodoxin